MTAEANASHCTGGMSSHAEQKCFNLICILPSVSIEKPDCWAPSRDTWVRVRDTQKGRQPAHAAGAHIPKPVFGKEVGCV